MLSKEENELLTRVGPGTPMGKFMREYWIPAVLSTELPAGDCTPLRIRILGEKLIAFRATSGRVGIIADACPHRGASLFFGRNEEEGLRCVYHGWKFDVEGNCVDMPSEPAESNFQSKVNAKAYPCEERGGLVWTYMGSRNTPPPLPDIEANILPNSIIRVGMVECNWLQAIENNMDTSHAGFLHFGSIPIDAPDEDFKKAYPDDWKNYILYKSPKFDVISAPYGASYACSRPADEEGSTYYRIMNFMFPFFSQSPVPHLQGDRRLCSATVPIDDEHTMSWGMNGGPTFVAPGEGRRSAPNSSGWLGRFRPALTAETDYDIDRELQRTDKTWRGYTGISASVPEQDRAITQSMGAIVDRSIEHLGTTDSMIIRVRRRLIDTVRTFVETGAAPGVDEPWLYRQRSGHIVLPNGVDVWEATEEMRQAFPEAAFSSPVAAGSGHITGGKP